MSKENIYANSSNTNDQMRQRNNATPCPGSEFAERRDHRLAVVGLGLLCVLLLTALIALAVYRYICPSGWRRFKCSCYSISTEEKTWNDSRQACMQLGADLAIISSREEQEFMSSIPGDFWIGLSDTEREGIWKWVDGTTIPVEKGYWLMDVKQPDDYNGNEDCVEQRTRNYDPGWNDLTCSHTLNWMCESVPWCYPTY